MPGSGASAGGETRRSSPTPSVVNASAAERATRETENSLELRTRDRYRKLIGKIDSTLKRVDSGEYGYSVDSGEEIGLDRLEARLTAERTIDEQERWEHLQKQIGD